MTKPEQKQSSPANQVRPNGQGAGAGAAEDKRQLEIGCQNGNAEGSTVGRLAALKRENR